MEKVKVLMDKAQSTLHSADHRLTQTYPLVKDPKLFVGVLNNMSISLLYAMESILRFDMVYKRIQPYGDTFVQKFNTFKLKSAKLHKIKAEDVALIQELRTMVKDHQKSPVEFVRKEMFVICSDKYRMKTLNISDLRKYLDKTKLFIRVANSIIR